LDRARDAIAAAGGDVVCVFMYRAEPTRNFCRKREVELDCYGDPERELYDAVGLERGGVRELYSPRVALGALRAARKGAVAGDPQGGDTHQMPGTFVVATDGRLAFAHYNRDQSDNPSTKAVLAAVERAAGGR
jgi:AhpC/TSA antioxidant enzyme